MGVISKARWRGLIVAVKRMKSPEEIEQEDYANFLHEIDIMRFVF